MKSFISIPIRCSLVLLIVALLVSGCSSSSDSNSGESQTDGDVSAINGNGMASDGSTDSGENEMEDANTGDTTSGTQTESTDGSEESTSGSGTGSTLDSEGLSTTRVDFDITVPVYSSSTLQVRLVWGDIDTTAIWDIDQHWTASADFPVNTTNQLVVTFSDDNGAVTLGSLERSFTTGASQSESVQITADEFDTDRWDSDGNGVSNLNESIAGTNPQGSDVLEPVQASLELVQDKTFRISWQQSEGAQFYRVLENPDGVSGFTGISEDLNAMTTDFDHRVALYARVNAQYLVQSCNDQGCVDSEPVFVAGTLASAIGYFKASNTDQRDEFGVSVSLSANGDTLAVGAFNESSAATGINGDEDDNSADGSGAVYIFARNGVIWQQQAYIKASNTDSEDEFGYSVSLSADGNTLAVGARGEASRATGITGDEDDNSADESGAVFVFGRNAETWQQQAYVKASNSDQSDRFGRSVSLSADGNTLAVGATSEDSAATGINGDQNEGVLITSGAVYVFVRNGESWQQQAYVKASNTGRFDSFGWSVSLSADGNTLAVGAIQEASRATGINGNQRDNSTPLAGAVYVFVRDAETWQQQAYLKASNTGQFDFFGWSVSLSADGNTLAVGAHNEDSAVIGVNGDQSDNPSAGLSGAVYLFARSGETWQQEAYIKASNTDSEDEFGFSVNLSADGNTLAVGADGEDGGTTGINGDQNDNSADGSGAVYVFARNGAIWQQQAYIKASNPDGGDVFGRSVSLSADGNTLAVGSLGEDSAAIGINGDQDDNSVSGSGAVYLY